MHYKFCVMGNPIEQSRSPWIHAQFARQCQLSVDYIKVKPDLTRFVDAVNQFKKDKGFAFNVTLPFKHEAYHLADTKSERAEMAKSVNTMRFDAGDKIFGDNTDGIGLLTDITTNLHYSLAKKAILILGAGGAVRGILEPLLSQNPDVVIIANRTLQNALKLVTEFKSFGNVMGCGLDDLKNLKVDVIIDGTGFNADITLPDSLSLSSDSLCYDLKYGSNETKFLTWSKNKGSKRSVDGLGMLVEQAAEAFYVWTGQKPDTQSVLKLARKVF